MSKLFSPNTSKAAGGGVGAGIGLAASEPVAESLTRIIVWLISMLVGVPMEIQDAIDFLIRLAVTFGVGYAGAWLAPPNSHSYFLREKEKGI